MAASEDDLSASFTSKLYLSFYDYRVSRPAQSAYAFLNCKGRQAQLRQESATKHCAIRATVYKKGN